MNYDYMDFNTYRGFKPIGSEYHTQNQEKMITTFSSSYNCGDCLRGNFIYCTQSDVFGSTY